MILNISNKYSFVAIRRNPLPKRSRRIAAQPLAHIPTFKRGEVLLYAEDGLCTAGSSSFIRIEASI
jgi:hypothetical protein